MLPAAVDPLVGSETPRLWTPARRELTPETTRGFQAIEFAEDILGVTLMPWQRWLFIHALETTESGAFRFRTVLVLIARQNGKTTWMQVLALWRMYLDAAGLVIGTAQNLDVAEEAWTGAVDMAEGVPDLRAEIAAVDRTNGKKALRLTSGERYKVAAASRRGGRGLSGDLVVLDEIREHQTWEAWGAVTKTTMARERPQIVCLSNAGDAQSIVLNHLHDLGMKTLDGSGDGALGLFEWSAEPGCDMADRGAWVQANPALGYRITEDAIAAALETDPEQVFRTEVLCQRIEDFHEMVVPVALWRDCGDPSAAPLDPVSFAFDVAPRFTSAAIVACGADKQGRPVVEVVEHHGGTSWLVDRLKGLTESYGYGAVGLDLSGPAAAMQAELVAAGVQVDGLTGPRMAQACGGLVEAVNDGAIRHRNEPPLDAALAGVRARPAGDGGQRWSRTDSTVDISPLVAATVARQLWAERSGGGEPGMWVL